MFQLSRPADQSILIAKIGLDIAKILVYARFGAGRQRLTRCVSHICCREGFQAAAVS
jgi:hypothetical protein